MATRMLQRRGTAVEWAAANPVLAAGEIGLETDTKVFKIGDGVSAWADLQMIYLTTGGGIMTGHLVVLEPEEAGHPARLVDLPDLSPYALTTYVNSKDALKVAKAGDAMSGPLTMNEQQIVRPELLGYQENEIVSSTATMTVDFHAAQLYRTTYSGGLTIAWSNLPAAGKIRVSTLVIPSTITSVTWPAGTLFPGQTAPELIGETWISVVARGSSVTVGVSWTEVA